MIRDVTENKRWKFGSGGIIVNFWDVKMPWKSFYELITIRVCQQRVLKL